MKTANFIEPKHGSAQAANLEQADPERRRSPRHHTVKSALIVSNGGRNEMPCHILNVSDTGALLKSTDVLLCPSKFILKPDVGEQRDCEVVWCNGVTLAVRFMNRRPARASFALE
jgi:hypothetical protein